MKQRCQLVGVVFAVVIVFSMFPLYAQEVELAATLEVLTPGVEMLRVNTVNWVMINVEAVVGVGDTIRTDATGQARVTFFEDGTETDVLPNSELIIGAFSGSETQFTISVEVVIGQTIQRLNRLLDASSRYDVLTPGMSLGARGTQFAVRVEPNGRSAMLVTEGDVQAAKDDDEAASVPLGFGIRAARNDDLSDVVRAMTFEELDAALDGCTVILTTPDDTSLNVRQAPGIEFPRVGTVAAADVTTIIGETETSGWYRIEFRGGFGWILSSTLDIQTPCAGVRSFADDTTVEDPARYESLGDAIMLEDLMPVALGE